jgi:thiol reductant ABC exporter CydD subunit
MGQRACDPRLLGHAPATRSFIASAVVIGIASALLVIAQAWLLAEVISAAFAAGRGVAHVRGALEALVCVVVARSLLAWATQVAASRSAAQAKSQLRRSLLRRAATIGRDGLASDRTGELATLASRGIDALDSYFSLYLPQLCLAVIVPCAVLAVMAYEDWISAAIIAATLPLIPLFMALVGATTSERMDQQFRLLQRLGGHFLDVVAGLPTLKVFGRAKAQIGEVGAITERYRRATMATLRVSFLSSLILELVATISVALVAVEVGLRLMGGALDLRTALFVLVLAPEAYLPLRLLGANYHASAEGVSAAERVFEVLERPEPPRGMRTDVPDPAASGLSVQGLTVARSGRAEPVLDGLSLSVAPGEVLAVTGPSGCGKSTLLGVLLGLVAPDGGSVSVGGLALSELDLDAWRARASIAENVRLGRPDASPEELLEAVANAGLLDVIARLPRGLDTALGERGAGLSAGERQRIALARAFLRDASLLLLDEPTANLDGETEEAVLDAVGRLVRGRTTVIAAHRPALVALADHVLPLGLTAAVA